MDNPDVTQNKPRVKKRKVVEKPSRKIQKPTSKELSVFRRDEIEKQLLSYEEELKEIMEDEYEPISNSEKYVFIEDEQHCHLSEELREIIKDLPKIPQRKQSAETEELCKSVLASSKNVGASTELSETLPFALEECKKMVDDIFNILWRNSYFSTIHNILSRKTYLDKYYSLQYDSKLKKECSPELLQRIEALHTHSILSWMVENSDEVAERIYWNEKDHRSFESNVGTTTQNSYSKILKVSSIENRNKTPIELVKPICEIGYLGFIRFILHCFGEALKVHLPGSDNEKLEQMVKKYAIDATIFTSELDTIRSIELRDRFVFSMFGKILELVRTEEVYLKLSKVITTEVFILQYYK